MSALDNYDQLDVHLQKATGKSGGECLGKRVKIFSQQERSLVDSGKQLQEATKVLDDFTTSEFGGTTAPYMRSVTMISDDITYPNIVMD